MKVEVDNVIKIPKSEISEEQLKELKYNFMWKNPLFGRMYKFKKGKGRYQRRDGKKLSPWLYSIWIEKDEIHIARGGMDKVKKILGCDFQIRSNSYSISVPDGIIYNEKNMPEIGSISGHIGSGKITRAIDLIFLRKEKTLILVKQLKDIDRWKKALGLRGFDFRSVGVLGGGAQTIGDITIATYRALYNFPIYNDFGQLIVYNAHELGLNVFLRIIKEFRGKYILGLVIPSQREDGTIFFQRSFTGPVFEMVERKKKISVKKINTEFSFQYNDDYIEMVEILEKDIKRNNFIIESIENYVRNRKVLVLTNTKKHKKKIESSVKFGKVKVLVYNRLEAIIYNNYYDIIIIAMPYSDYKISAKIVALLCEDGLIVELSDNVYVLQASLKKRIENYGGCNYD